MIFHDVEQNTLEWQRLRLGIATASDFHRIMTPKKRQLSAQANDYMHLLLAEWWSGEPMEYEYQSPWMERGQALEDQAVAAYEGLTGLLTTRGGFWTTDDGLIGCSPDRMVGVDGDLEIKCPLLPRQIANALSEEAKDDYLCQLQGRMMIHGRQWIDVFSFHPLLVMDPVRVFRDEAFIADLRRTLSAFVDVLLKTRVLLSERHPAAFAAVRKRLEPRPQTDERDFVNEEDVEAILEAQRKEKP
ncbi:MAG TPA: YqaJ viral recombinase family protein [Bryobacteraceae bacterium]|jgi:hypothetical protein